MGWWRANVNGGIDWNGDTRFEDPNNHPVWGDGPADILDAALQKIVDEFNREWGRPPTLAELEAGFKFSTSIYEEDRTEGRYTV